MNSVKWRGVAVVSAMTVAVAGMVAMTPGSASAAPAREAPSYRVTDLGTLPGAPDSTAMGINNRGDVVGTSGARAVLWRNGRTIDLGTLGGSYSAAVDVNKRGDVVGYSEVAEGGANHAFIWRGGRLIDLSPLPGFWSSFASAVNDSGDVVGWSSVYDGGSRAVLWRRDGTVVDLTAKTGLSGVTDLDNAGRLVGVVRPDGMNGYPALWYRGRLTVLIDTYGTASAINDRGEITGYLVDGNSFVWRRGQLTEIPRLPDTPSDSLQAQGINNRGQVVGFGGFDGFVWDSDTATLTTLPGLITGLGPAAYDINDRGQIVASAGITPQNITSHAILLSPRHH
jgi:probable HAF family extracellular repeat protein